MRDAHVLEFGAVFPVDRLAVVDQLTGNVEQKPRIFDSSRKVPEELVTRRCEDSVVGLVVAFDNPVLVEVVEPLISLLYVIESILQIHGRNAVLRKWEMIRSIKRSLQSLSERQNRGLWSSTCCFWCVLACDGAILSLCSALYKRVNVGEALARVAHILRSAKGGHHIDIEASYCFCQRYQRGADVMKRTEENLLLAGCEEK